MPPPRPARQQTVTVEGRTLRLSNLDKVLYPATGTTKADVLAYYAAVAPQLIRHAGHRPVTRKRWVHGVGTPEEPGQVFFQKNIDDNAPAWVARNAIQHKDHVNVYPMVDDLATLTWLGQIAAIEIHVPQWRFGPDGGKGDPDRLVLDLDPGPGAELAECAEVALLARPILQDMGLEPFPVTSGSKGIHLYCALDGRQTSDQVSAVAHELARALEADHPDLAVSDMKKALRSGKVLVDWSQNNANKTTVSPYSLRGRFEPTVAAPRTWEELAEQGLAHLDFREVMQRVESLGDILADATAPLPATISGATRPEDRLSTYRSMRDAAKTPEPVPEAVGPAGGNSFVIQEHHARRLHYDFRLERDGVLVSWAIPKGPPLTPSRNHLAVQTEDHPLDYGSFEGTIPKGEYGGGEVSIWDAGTYELEKWRDGKEVICTLHGRPDGGLARGGTGIRRYALIHTGGGASGKSNWLIHLMKEQPAEARNATADGGSGPEEVGTVEEPEAPTAAGGTPARPVRPMLATLGSQQAIPDPDQWAYEMKWDGVRCIAVVENGQVTLLSRNGIDTTSTYPELGDLGDLLSAERAVLDGEIVALNAKGRPDFGLLQKRMKLTHSAEIEGARRKTPVRLMLFDLLELDGNDLTGLQYCQRRELLEKAVDEAEDGHVQVPPALDATLDEAVEASRQLGLEGIMAKRLTSDYQPGARSSSWVKIKHLHTQEVVVVGWRPGKGSRASKVGSLLVAVPDGVDLRYVGRVGSGLTERDLAEVGARLKKLARKTAPLDDVPGADASDAQWVRPSLVGEVQYSEHTGTGRLRHPVWRGWRPDKTPSDVVVEL
ncbi:ATP-dependent DNA ligase [Arthrobacter agilis]|uniref:ATP-dependent DNA ligase n=1 Tax=Arthrobacter agilis TaxID=37921 RepID=UPI000B35EE73|nr:ATP-dependent DNA ligase [Arthrobacter agilis]OUM42345.1 ATP-dependent DNA ligase [Arthrobacter agilis]PPB45686.1 ATP-dependent DNA ligase [Arthrobacter agilis]TPV26334.1 ATP-dependent DNA ligase [Arthrobacter agilis]